MGFEPMRAKPNGLAGRRLNHSAKVSTLKFGKIFLYHSFEIFFKNIMEKNDSTGGDRTPGQMKIWNVF